MYKFVMKRFFTSALIVIAVIVISFAIMHSVPGGPFDKEKTLPDKIKANIEKKFKLDLPVHKQLLDYLLSVSTGDFGPSYKYLGRSVNEIIKDALPVSASLGLLAFVLALLLGFLGSILSVWKVRKFLDYAVQFFSSLSVSFPSFVVASFFILIFSEKLKIFPPALWEGAQYVIMPALTLALAPAAYIARLLRGSILQIYNSNYVLSARAKGVDEFKLFLKHILPNSIMPVITITGPLLAGLVTGSFIVEEIFSIPGMGKFFVLAVTNRDYPLIMGITIVYSVILVFANFAVDICYLLLEPKLRREMQSL
ncbi:MAG: ABC transporter permease [Candidatus Schekmanbacteria bacterium]|nr:MAG: ABC transporter permease [Candidatus Schekmanbacteria bacterium]